MKVQRTPMTPAREPTTPTSTTGQTRSPDDVRRIFDELRRSLPPDGPPKRIALPSPEVQLGRRAEMRGRDDAVRTRVDAPAAPRGPFPTAARGLGGGQAPTSTPPVSTTTPGTGPRVIGPNGDAQPLNPAQLSTPEEAREVLALLQRLGLSGGTVTENQLGGPYRYEFGDDPRRVFMIGNMNAGLVRDTLRNNPPHIAEERLRLDLQHKPILFGP